MKNLGLLFAVLLGSCALTGIDQARVSTTTAVHVFDAAVDTLQAADKAHADAAVAKAQAGDPAGAAVDLAAWQKKYDACYKGLQILWDSITAAADAVSAADQGKASLNSDNLLKALADVAKIFADSGLKLPSGVV